MRVVLVVFALAVSVSTASALRLDRFQPQRAGEMLDHVARWFRGPLPTEPINPDFSQLEQGTPVGWSKVGHPLVISDATGTHVRVSRLHYFQQDLDLAEGVAHAVRARVRGLTGGETVVTTNWFAPETDWFYVTDSITAGGAPFRLSAFTLMTDEWIEVDSLHLMDEFLDEPGFEQAGDGERPAGWHGEGRRDTDNANSGQARAAVPPGTSLWQQLAVDPGDQTYSLSGWIAGEAVDTATVEIRWLDNRENLVEREVFEIDVSTDWRPFGLTLHPPPHDRFTFHGVLSLRPVLCEIHLGSGQAGTTAYYDDLHFGWAAALPTSITPDGDGHRDTAQVRWLADTAADWRIEIRDPDEALVTLVEAMGVRGLNQYDWNGRDQDGATLSPGVYRIDLIPTGSMRPAATLTTRVRIDPPGPELDWERHDDWVPIGAFYDLTWHNPTPLARMERDFASLARAGFNTIYMMNGTPGVPNAGIIDAACRNGLRIFFSPPELLFNIFARPHHGDIPPEAVRAQFQALYDEIGDPDCLVGSVFFDEPPPEIVPHLRTYARVLAEFRLDHPPFTVSLNVNDAAGFTAATNSPTFIYEIYPTDYWVPVGDYRDLSNRFRNAAETANRHDVPLWVIVTAHTEPFRYRRDNPFETRRVLYEALGQGAQGFFYFLANGPRYIDGRMTGILDSEGALNQPELSTLFEEVRALAPLLLQTQAVPAVAQTGDPVALGTLASATDALYLVATHQDCTQGIEADLELDDPRYASARDMLTGETLAIDEGRLRLPLGPGQGRVLALLETTARPGPLPSPPAAYGLPRVVTPVGAHFGGRGSYTRVVARGDWAAVVRMRATYEKPTILLGTGSLPQLVHRGLLSHEIAHQVHIEEDVLWVTDVTLGLARYRLQDGAATLLDRVTHLPGNAQSVAFANDRVYVAARREGFRIMEAAQDGPRLLGHSSNEINTAFVAVQGTLALALSDLWQSGLYDVDDPGDIRFVRELPEVVSHVQDAVTAFGLTYVAAQDNGLLVLKAERPAGLEVVFRDKTRDALGVYVHEDLLLLSDGVGGLRIYDLARPDAPHFLDAVLPHAQAGVTYAAVQGNHLLLTTHAHGLQVLRLDDVLPASSALRLR